MNDVLNLLWALMWWFTGLGVHLTIVTSMMVTVTWSLLIVFRFLGIPWVDGTHNGYIDRY